MILTRALNFSAMTFLIFLSRAAWAWVVASDFRMVADDGARFARVLARGRGRGVGFSEGYMAAAGAAVQALLGRLFDGALPGVERAPRLRVGAVRDRLQRG